MCGIAGILSGSGAPPSLEELRRMAGALRHRGPDEFGVYRDARCGLAHARLAIVDLVAGQQPLANEDETLWIAYNGEVYNAPELRSELQALGHRFRTQSDTEVVVHAWESWGEDALGRFNGQWAFALWDRRRRRLVLSRDRLGVRPLYVARHRGRLWFASELKAFFAADASFPRALDPRGLEETFTFWGPLAPQTAFEGVEEVEPGHTLVEDPDLSRRRAFFHPVFPPQGGEAPLSMAESVCAVRAALDRATALRMLRADVPVGCYLSGGLDSALVAALARQACGGPFATFSLRFEDADLDEGEHQRAMARALGSAHHELTCQTSDIAAAFPRAVCHAERPLLRTAPVPMLLLSEAVRRAGTKVVLTGEGADELFAGYDLFREAKVRRFCARRPDSRWRPQLLRRLYPYLSRSPSALGGMTTRFFLQELQHASRPGFSHGPRWRNASALERLFATEFAERLHGFDPVARLLASLPEGYGTWSSLAQDQYLELRTLLPGYVLSAQGDRMLMAGSVEGRFPFLDHEVATLAAALPPAHKLRVLDEKAVLKHVARRLVPEAILTRKKQPYRAPDATSFLCPRVPAYVDELLSPSAVAAAGVFDPGRVGRLWSKCRASVGRGPLSNADNMALVGVLSTQLLHHECVARRPTADDVPLRTRVEA